ncbi:hypothetical protein L6452_01660 [Arctium lappa]|uniref:Uncharacterized protein n=1 Tax=Arctium lappa TaxID=4217 RepID=A0ACB9FHD7_ARCLA|nr:hypothetical protein L6452_01660 [Arctium lappa]
MRNFLVTGDKSVGDDGEGEERTQGIGDTIMELSSNNQLEKDSGRMKNFPVTGDKSVEDDGEGEERMQGIGDTLMESSSNNQNGDSKELNEGDKAYKKKKAMEVDFDNMDRLDVGFEVGPVNNLKDGSKKDKGIQVGGCHTMSKDENREAHYASNVKKHQLEESAFGDNSGMPDNGCDRNNNSTCIFSKPWSRETEQKEVER